MEFKILDENTVPDMALYFRKADVSKNKFIFTGRFVESSHFGIRNLRNLFFKNEIFAFGAYEEDDLTKIVIIDLPQYAKFNYATLSMCDIREKDILEIAIKTFKENVESTIVKINAIVTQEELDLGFKNVLESIGFYKSALLRKFRTEEKDLYIYSIFLDKKGE